MGIRNQFEHFLTANDMIYPILLVRDDTFGDSDATEQLVSLVSEFAGDEQRNILSTLKVFSEPKAHSIESITNSDLRKQFVERYSGLNELFESQPYIRLLKPNKESGHGRVPLAAPPSPVPKNQPEPRATPFPTGSASEAPVSPFPTASKGEDS